MPKLELELNAARLAQELYTCSQDVQIDAGDEGILEWSQISTETKEYWGAMARHFIRRMMKQNRLFG